MCVTFKATNDNNENDAKKIQDLLLEIEQLKTIVTKQETEIVHLRKENKRLVNNTEVIKCEHDKRLKAVNNDFCKIVDKETRSQAVLKIQADLATRLQTQIKQMAKDDLAKSEELVEVKSQLKASRHVIMAINAIHEHRSIINKEVIMTEQEKEKVHLRKVYKRLAESTQVIKCQHKRLKAVNNDLCKIVDKATRSQADLKAQADLATRLQTQIKLMAKDDLAKSEELAELKMQLRASREVIVAMDVIFEYRMKEALSLLLRKRCASY